jgi:hypothetical protein
MHPKTLEGQVRSGAGQDPLSSGNYAKLRKKCTEMKSYPGLLPKDWSEFDVRDPVSWRGSTLRRRLTQEGGAPAAILRVT